MSFGVPGAAFKTLTSIHEIPVIEHTLRESLSTGRGAELAIETERLHDREVCFNGEHGCSYPLFLADHLATALVQYVVDTTNGLFRTLNFHCKLNVNVNILRKQVHQ